MFLNHLKQTRIKEIVNIEVLKGNIGKKMDYYCSPAILAAASFLLILILETVLLIALIPQKISPNTTEKNPIVKNTLMIEGIGVIAIHHEFITHF